MLDVIQAQDVDFRGVEQLLLARIARGVVDGRHQEGRLRDRRAIAAVALNRLEPAWRKGHRWEPGTDLRAWLFTLMHNLYVNGLRRKQLETEQMTHEDHEDTKQRPPDSGLDLRDLETGLT